MTLEELKAKHPELVKQIADGAKAEAKANVAAWLTYHEIDPAKAVEGAKTGLPVDPVAQAEFNVAGIKKNETAAAAAGNAPDLDTQPTQELQTATAGKPGGKDAEAKAKAEQEKQDFLKEVLAEAGVKTEENAK